MAGKGKRLTKPARSGTLGAPWLRALSLVVLALTFVITASACSDDPFGFDRWEANPDTAVLFSLARPELNLDSAYDFVIRQPIRVERVGSTGSWDVALDTDGGQLVLIAPGALGILSEARVTELPNTAFDEATEAPRDTAAYTATAGLPLRTTSVYVFRTRRAREPIFGQSCTFYGKLQPLVVDPVAGALEFVFDANTSLAGCNNRDLVPPR